MKHPVQIIACILVGLIASAADADRIELRNSIRRPSVDQPVRLARHGGHDDSDLMARIDLALQGFLHHRIHEVDAEQDPLHGIPFEPEQESGVVPGLRQFRWGDPVEGCDE